MTRHWRTWLKQSYGWLRKQDLLALLLLLMAVLSVWAFVELADEMMEGETHAVDAEVLRSLRNPADPSDPLGPVWVEDAVRDLTALGSTVVLSLVTGAVTGFVILRRKFHALGLILIAIAGGLLLNVLLKSYFDRPRPDLVPPIAHVSTASFPSGHSLLSAVVYLTLGALLTRLVQPLKLKLYIIGIAVMLSFLVGLSRIYLGVHYPTDVLAGWSVGLVWAILCWLAADYLQRRGLVEKPNATSE